MQLWYREQLWISWVSLLPQALIFDWWALMATQALLKSLT
jgi:hypothetical protein